MSGLPVHLSPAEILAGVGLFAGWAFYQLGVLSPAHLRSPLARHRIRRSAYGVVMRAFKLRAPEATGTPQQQRAARRTHERTIVRRIERGGRWATYVELWLPAGADTSDGAESRLRFERTWRSSMTRPTERGEPAHDWTFIYRVGTGTVAVRTTPLTDPSVTRLFEHLQPFFTWPEGTRPADVIHLDRV